MIPLAGDLGRRLVQLLQVSGTPATATRDTYLGILQWSGVDEVWQSRGILEIARCLALSDRFILESKRIKLWLSIRAAALRAESTYPPANPPRPLHPEHHSSFPGSLGSHSPARSSPPCHSGCSARELWPIGHEGAHLNLVDVDTLVLLLHLLVGDLHSVHCGHLRVSHNPCGNPIAGIR